MVDINFEYDPNFLNEEIRDGYLVTSDIKKLWLVQLDILNMFLNVCKKHNLHYFTEGGTTLGAVRHKGFIPWDDDIDVIMFRDDFMKLVQILKEELKYPYYMEYMETASFTMKIKRLDTTMIRLNNPEDIPSEFNKSEYKSPKCIGIDVFCFDNFPEEPDEIEKFKESLKFKAYVYRHSRFAYDYQYKRFDVKIDDLNKFKNRIKTSFNDYQIICQTYDNIDTKYIFNNCFPNHLENFEQVKYKEDYQDYVIFPFEMFELRLPVGYERVLDMHYTKRTGIPWQTPAKNLAYHNQELKLFLDFDNPYTKYTLDFYDKPEDVVKY